MNKKFILYILFFIFSFKVFSQGIPHMELLSHVKISEHSSSIWGYTDPKGIEYALLGTAEGLRIYSLEDPRNPIERSFIPAINSSWRELKTYKDHIYVVTEAHNGMLIVDMSKAPTEFNHRFIQDYANDQGDSFKIVTTHTIYADDDGYLYLTGASPTGYGCAILDAKSNPMQPVFISSIDSIYFHEVHVFDNIMYSAELFAGQVAMWDIKDKKNPIRITDHPTAASFTHAAWVERNRKILYTTDERTQAPVEVWDVGHPFSIRKLSEYNIYPTEKNNTIPHNVFHHGRYLYVSWYTEGVRVLDTKDPENLVEVGYYDTYPTPDQGFHGCWSVYPFFASGICIASDIENGLFVMKFDNNVASFIQGKVTDITNGNSIENAEVVLYNSPDNSKTKYADINGDYKAGFEEEGIIQITVRKKGYQVYNAAVMMRRDSIFNLNVQLTPLPNYTVTINSKIKNQGNALADCHVKIWNDEFSYSGITNQNGEVQIPKVILGTYNIAVGKWGYLYGFSKDLLIQNTVNLDYDLTKGYQDDFIFDYQWTTSTNDKYVKFKRGDFSELTTKFSNYPTKDVPNDIGVECYYTNNYEEFDDIWKLQGYLQLESPWMDFTGYATVDASYSAWAYGGGDSAQAKIFIETPMGRTLIEDVQPNFTGKFNPETKFTIDLAGKPKDSIRLVFYLFNKPEQVSVAISVKATFDNFKAVGDKISANDPVDKSKFQIYPNPTRDFFYIKNETSMVQNFDVYDLQGSIITTLTVEPEMKVKILENKQAGIYLVKNNQSGETTKILKI